MSHVEMVEIECRDLDALRVAVERLGGEIRNQQTVVTGQDVSPREREARYRRALRSWLAKFDVQVRWPCRECGRTSPDDPFRSNLVTQADGKQALQVCTMCNADGLVRLTRETLRIGELP